MTNLSKYHSCDSHHTKGVIVQSPITLEALHILDAIDRRGSFAAAANEL
ncbi:LysR family transcriptional regulator, partial [Vibrio sp. Vb0599]|nr:LysR family transcriptional regulator [Vibrio sp. Vb0599]